MPQFKKCERLCSTKLMDMVFDKGKSFLIYPFRVSFLPVEHSSAIPVKVTFAVPRKVFRKAVQRNKIRRKCREAYRLNKESLYAALNLEKKQIAVVMVYVAKEALKYSTIEGKIILTLQRLIQENETICNMDIN